MIQKKRTAAIIFNDQRAILMVMWKWHEELRTPWWTIEEWESELECLARELQEETWLILSDATFVQKFEWPSAYTPNTTVHNFVYLCDVRGTITIDNEIAAYIRLDKDSYKTKKYKHVPADIQVFDYLLANNIR